MYNIHIIIKNKNKKKHQICGTIGLWWFCLTHIHQMSPKSDTKTVCHRWRHSGFSVQDMKKNHPLKTISIKFATFWSLFQPIWTIFCHCMVIWSSKFEIEFPRIFEKSLVTNGLMDKPKSTFFRKTHSMRTFHPFFVSKTPNLWKNWSPMILLNPYSPSVT